MSCSRTANQGRPRTATLQQFEQQLRDERALGSQAALSSDGKIVAGSQGGVVCLWETASGKKLHQLQTRQKRLVQLAFSADARSLLTLGTRGQASAVWDVATGKCVRSSEGKDGGGLDINEQNALVSPGWKYLAYLTRNDAGNRLIHARDLATGKELAQIDVGGFGPTQTLSFSADDKTLVWDHYPARGIVLTDVTTGKELRRLRDQTAARKGTSSLTRQWPSPFRQTASCLPSAARATSSSYGTWHRAK